MNNNFLLNIFRFGFLGILFYEIFSWKILNNQATFSWGGLILTIVAVWIFFEALFWHFRKINIKISWFSFAGAFFSLSLDALGDMQGWYMAYSPWFDKFAHFAGGFVVAIIAYDILRNIKIKNTASFSEKWLLILSVLIAFLFSFGYEWLEYAEDVFYWGKQVRLGDGYDTINDLQLDLMGSIIAIAVVILLKGRFYKR